MNRREFMKLSAAVAATLPTVGVIARADDTCSETVGRPAGMANPSRGCNGAYEGSTLSRVAFPMGAACWMTSLMPPHGRWWACLTRRSIASPITASAMV